MISYLFQIADNDNPYLETILLNLQLIAENIGIPVCVPTFPLVWLCAPFTSDFYSYGGSLTYPPCTEGVTWFINPKLIAISKQQMKCFRNIKNMYGMKMVRNSRPVQCLNGRTIVFNKFKGVQTK